MSATLYDRETIVRRYADGESARSIAADFGCAEDTVRWHARNAGVIRHELPVIQRFDEFVMPEPNSGCHLWIGAVSPFGYGVLRVNGRTMRAHRFIYETTVGPIPAGLVICHRCDTPPCVNPDHFFLGTIADNNYDMRRKGRARMVPAEMLRAKTHCVNGHPLSGDNLWIRVSATGEERHCRTCRRAAVQRWRSKQLSSNAHERRLIGECVRDLVTAHVLNRAMRISQEENN